MDTMFFKLKGLPDEALFKAIIGLIANAYEAGVESTYGHYTEEKGLDIDSVNIEKEKYFKNIIEQLNN